MIFQQDQGDVIKQVDLVDQENSPALQIKVFVVTEVVVIHVILVRVFIKVVIMGVPLLVSPVPDMTVVGVAAQPLSHVISFNTPSAILQEMEALSQGQLISPCVTIRVDHRLLLLQIVDIPSPNGVMGIHHHREVMWLQGIKVLLPVLLKAPTIHQPHLHHY